MILHDTSIYIDIRIDGIEDVAKTSNGYRADLAIVDNSSNMAICRSADPSRRQGRARQKRDYMQQVSSQSKRKKETKAR